MSTLTDWFPPDVNPLRDGVYQLQNTSTGRTFFSKWIIQEGAFAFYVGWSAGHLNAEDAAKETQHGIVQGRWPWRGLAQKPLEPGESRKIGANMYEVYFTEGPDRPYSDD